MDEKHSSRIKQVSVYFGRCWRGFFHDKSWKLLISVVLITLLISSVTGENMFVTYWDTKDGAFTLVCACIWIGLFNSIRTICRERDILKHDHRTGLHMSAYAAAHWLYELCLCAIEALPVTALVWFMNRSHFIEEGVIFPPAVELFITFFLILFSSDALALLISSIVTNENTAMTVMPFALIIQLVMAGLIFILEGAAKTISAATISRWGLDAICVSAHVDEMGYAVEEELLSTPENLRWLWLVLFCFAVLYGVLSAIALEFVDLY
ncbi:MAG: ABC transporter permease [Lachnospiraceae bacterium]|nr:ABC transporter permease [Lachnospiraceae bacterium]